MTTRLPKRPEQLFIDELLLQSTADGGWDPSGALGYDPQANPGEEAFLPVATSIDNVGAVYPSLVVTYSSETSGGETTYDFMTTEGAGQQRNGQLVATVRARDTEADEGYTGDSDVYAAVDAEEIVDTIVAEVEDVCLRNQQGASTEFSYLGSQRGPDVPDDFDESTPVRIADATISYGWDRAP